MPKILQYPSEVLTKVCTPISTKDAKGVIALLEETLYGENGEYIGLGLAANQIGIDAQICIIRCLNYRIDLVNPKILQYGKPLLQAEEGCLSFPNRYIEVLRYSKVSVLASNHLDVLHIDIPLVARVIQHEIDHLQGKSIIDHTIPKRNDLCVCGSGKKYKKCCGAYVGTYYVS